MKKYFAVKLSIAMLIAIAVLTAYHAGYYSARVSLETPSPTTTPAPFVIPKITQAPTATPTLVAVPPTMIPIPDVYEVKQGDTLEKIAEVFNVPLGYLADQNGITNPDLIYPGQIIRKPPWPPLPDTSDRQIIVELSTQQVFVYEKDKLLKTFLVSTGVKDYPTVTGHYNIYIKLLSTTMDGPGYHLPNVQYTMYFYKGYGLHGTYWHNNFGHPMSHGCINLRTEDAEWLFNWASVGTPVWIIE